MHLGRGLWRTWPRRWSLLSDLQLLQLPLRRRRRLLVGDLHHCDDAEDLRLIAPQLDGPQRPSDGWPNREMDRSAHHAGAASSAPRPDPQFTE